MAQLQAILDALGQPWNTTHLLPAPCYGLRPCSAVCHLWTWHLRAVAVVVTYFQRNSGTAQHFVGAGLWCEGGKATASNQLVLCF